MRHAVSRLGQPGAPRFGAPQETGYLVPHGDVGALAARMLELAGDPVSSPDWAMLPAGSPNG